MVGTGWVGSSVAISTLHNAAAQAGEVIPPALDDHKGSALEHSAKVLKNAIASRSKDG
jgi:hypothetical protein